MQADDRLAELEPPRGLVHGRCGDLGSASLASGDQRHHHHTTREPQGADVALFAAAAAKGETEHERAETKRSRCAT